MRLTVITYGAAISAAEIRAGRFEGMIDIQACCCKTWK